MKQTEMYKKELKKKNSSSLKMFKTGGGLSKNAKNAIDSCVIRNDKIYPFFWSRSGKNLRGIDYSPYIIGLLKLAGYKFKKGNDSPKNGKEGDYIKVSRTALNLIKTLN